MLYGANHLEATATFVRTPILETFEEGKKRGSRAKREPGVMAQARDFARNIEILVRRRRRRVARPFRGLELGSMISIIIHVTYFLQRWRIYAVVSC